MPSDYDIRKIDDKKLNVFKKQFDIPEKLFNCIKKNITDIDRKKYIRYGTLPLGVDKRQMEIKRQFTEDFLKLIDDETKKYDISNVLWFFERLTKFLIKLEPDASDLYNPQHAYAPANRLYFLFLANLYCNSKTYLSEDSKYILWLPQLLSIFEQTGLTGEFRIDKPLYNELFSECHTANSIKADLPFFEKWDPITKKHVPDYEYKSLSNSALTPRILLSKDPAVGWDKSKEKEEERQIQKNEEQTEEQKEKEAEEEIQKIIVEEAEADNQSVSIERKRELSLEDIGLEEETDIDKPDCPYGESCYRTNIQHRSDYHHLQPVNKRAKTNRSSLRDTHAGGKKTRKRGKHKRSKSNKRRTNKRRTNKRRTNKRSKTNKRKQI